MNDAQFAKLMGTKKINRTAQRREHSSERAGLIAKLGMVAEGGTPEGRYAATTGELRQWATELGL